MWPREERDARKKVKFCAVSSRKSWQSLSEIKRRTRISHVREAEMEAIPRSFLRIVFAFSPIVEPNPLGCLH